MTDELLCSEGRTRIYPIVYPDIWDFYQKSKASYWVPEEVDLSSDPTDWDKLDKDEQHFLGMVLAFFANSDLIVNENLDSDFTSLVQVPEAKLVYHYQTMMEDIHTTQYQLLIEAVIKNNDLKSYYYNSVYDNPSIKAKANWAKKWIRDGSWVQRLLAFSIVEGIFFSASFCSIFWVKKRGLCKGLGQSNEFIARDEGMHRDFAILLYTRYVRNKLPVSQVEQMIREAVEVESLFVNECLPYDLLGMNKSLMNQYVQFVADHLSLGLINKQIYGTANPFSWMNLISMEGKTNFFEKKVSAYGRQATLVDQSENMVSFEADF